MLASLAAPITTKPECPVNVVAALNNREPKNRSGDCAVIVFAFDFG